MIKRRPSLTRPPSVRRYVPPPSPMTAAIYQKTLMREAGGRDFCRPSQTSEQFMDEVENYIQESLLHTKGEFDQFKVYQNAFNYLIHKYPIHSAEMLLVKNGYDKVINDLIEKYNVGNKYRIIVQQSFTSLNNELQKKQAQFDKKKKGFADLISSVKSTSSDIREELVELKDQLIKETVECRASQEIANQNQGRLNHLVKKIDKLKGDEKEMTEWISNNKIRKAQLEEEVKQSKIYLSNVLDSISNSNREIDKTRASINEIEENILYIENQIKKKNDILVQQAEEKEIIMKDISSINENSQEIQNEISHSINELINILESTGVSQRQISMIGQDPVKLVALAISRKKGYMNGIEPELLATLS